MLVVLARVASLPSIHYLHCTQHTRTRISDSACVECLALHSIHEGYVIQTVRETGEDRYQDVIECSVEVHRTPYETALTSASYILQEY
jgi:hypothetical protein